MEKIKLTKREYLGEGYGHVFRNKETGEEKISLISQEEYEKMGGENGTKYNPTPEEGWEYIMSFGGFPLLNTIDSIGDNLDCFEKKGKFFVFEVDEKFKQLNLNEYSEEEFNSKYIWQ